MEPLSTAASVIAVATLAAQSCKMTYGLIDELVGAPQVMSNAKTLLSITQKTFNSLHESLEQTSDSPEGSGRLESVLRKIPLGDTLQSAQGLCSEFSVVLKECTRHSTGGSFSTRDRLTVSLRESKIQRYNKLLGEYQQAVNAVVDSIILYAMLEKLDQSPTNQRQIPSQRYIEKCRPARRSLQDPRASPG